MKSNIHLIRHGITEANQKRLYYGASDIPLADEGVKELSALVTKGVYPQFDEAELYTTGLLRTEQTFALIFGEKSHAHIEELQEMRFGEFEMKSHEELEPLSEYQEWIADKTGTLASPKGESIVDFSKRIKRGFERLVNNHRKRELSEDNAPKETISAIVCHGGTIAAIMEDCFPGGQEHFYKWIPDPGHGYTLTLENGEIISYSDF